MGQDLSTATEGASGPASEVPKSCDVEVFLIGKTGHGKSSTGNTILGRQRFKTSDSGESATMITDVGWARKNGMTIKVVDGPGLIDTRLPIKTQEEQLEKNLSDGLVHSPNGFHALVLVLSYGQRYTEEEKKTVKVLKKMLGNDFIGKHCVLVFTHGENFLTHHPDGNFKEWCENQQGDLGQLMNDCNKRIVLFHNMTMTSKQREDTFNEFISFVKQIKTRYTSMIFKDIAEKRIQFIKDKEAIQLQEPIQAKIDLIIGSMEANETGHSRTLVDELETYISGMKGVVADDIKLSIKQTREGNDVEGLGNFKRIRKNGKQLLVQLSKVIGRVLAAFVRSVVAELVVDNVID